MTTGRVIVVGASHAGAQLCASLRQEGWTGEIVLIGDEPVLPYHRPPLSKTFLAGQASLDDLLIRGPEFYAKQRITVRQGRVVRLDRAAQSLTLADGETLAYDRLALCLGAQPRRLTLPGAALPGVFALRSAADILAIRDALDAPKRVVIIGAGYIGLETAASLRQLGHAVTVLETAERVLQRVTAPVVSAFYARVHREQGAVLRTGIGIAALIGDERVQGVVLDTGESLPADVVIAGIGVVPAVDLAREAGLAVDNGIVIDAQGLTSDPHIVAAGDCARFPCPFSGRPLRLESVPNAGEHAKVAAATLCGKPGQDGQPKAISALPWFWSDQYDLKLQIAGLNTGYDEVVLRGDPASGRSFSAFYLREGQLLAADCINRPQDFTAARRLIAAGITPDRATLTDPAAALMAS